VINQLCSTETQQHEGVTSAVMTTVINDLCSTEKQHEGVTSAVMMTVINELCSTEKQHTS
jgi:hypothetical protein